jgi:penicillin-binding protein 1A
MRLVRILYVVCAVFFISCAFFLGAFFFVVHNKCIDFSALDLYQTHSPSIVLDADGNEWARFQLDRREPISYDQMPKLLIQAFIAAEDWKFFQHHGLSIKGIIRSLLINLYYGRKVQGASTITQQLVRLLFFDTKKTFVRKIKEQIYAILVEQQYTKEQIMQAYLNHAYFGCGIYGVEAASQRFWGKRSIDLSLDECATLAGIVQLPEGYCPLMYPLSAQKRRDIVLKNMHALGFISIQEYRKAQAMTVRVKKSDDDVQAPHFKDALRNFLEPIVGKEALYCGGLVIQSTMSRHVQRVAERVFREQCTAMRATICKEIDGAVLIMDSKSGAIRAMVGGYDYQTSKLNRALQAKRQLGSVFKPIVYAVAVQQGLSFADTEIDEPIEIMLGGQQWRPRNWDHRFLGRMTLASALSRSNNVVTIKTFLKVGAEDIIQLAKKCHIEGAMQPYPSLALGCVDVKVKEVAGYFNIFANNGIYVEPHYVEWVKDKCGSKIWYYTPTAEPVISSVVSGKVSKVLSIGIERIRRVMYQGKWIPSEAISKTGTTNESRTCWFVGSTPSMTTAVYVGCDDNRPMGNVYPNRTAFPIWREIHEALPDTKSSFDYDPRLREIYIDEFTGEVVSGEPNDRAVRIFV